MTKISILTAVTTLMTTGCIVVDSGPVNYQPEIFSAAAGCYWDNYYHDDVWYFDVEANDGDGPYDVVAVYADVYDLYRGTWVEAFPLDPTNDPYYWTSAWLGSTTYLYCEYDGYEVDLVAYDSYDAYDIVTVRPFTQ